MSRKATDWDWLAERRQYWRQGGEIQSIVTAPKLIKSVMVWARIYKISDTEASVVLRIPKENETDGREVGEKLMLDMADGFVTFLDPTATNAVGSCRIVVKNGMLGRRFVWISGEDPLVYRSTREQIADMKRTGYSPEEDHHVKQERFV